MDVDGAAQPPSSSVAAPPAVVLPETEAYVYLLATLLLVDRKSFEGVRLLLAPPFKFQCNRMECRH